LAASFSRTVSILLAEPRTLPSTLHFNPLVYCEPFAFRYVIRTYDCERFLSAVGHKLGDMLTLMRAILFAVRKANRFPNDTARFYAAGVALTFEYLHNRNIVYRDLKPENLLLDAHGHLKVCDFGFAKTVEPGTK
jgi:serine/threonine protein kinase